MDFKYTQRHSISAKDLEAKGSFDDSEHADMSESGLHLKDLIPRILARWHWILLCLLIGLGYGFYQAWKIIPKYRSTATVLVRDYNVSVLKTYDPAEFDLRSRAAMQTVRAGMMKYDLCELVAADPKVRELKGILPPRPKKLFKETENLEPREVPPAPRLAGMIQSWLEVNLQKESRLFHVSITHPEPKVAEVIANSVVNHYIDQRTALKKGGKKEDFDFLKAESNRVGEELSQAKSILASYSAPLDSEKALADAEKEIQSLSLRYREKHPQIIQAKAKVDASLVNLREALERSVKNEIDKEYWESHISLVTDLENEESLNKLRSLLVSRLSVLESGIQSQSSLYKTLLTQLETTELTSQQTDAEVLLYEKARYPHGTISEKPSRKVVKATMLGGIAGLALAFLFQALDRKFRTISDIEEAFTQPVLAAIGSLDQALKKEKRSSKRSRWSPSMVFAYEDTDTTAAEMFRVLRTSISLLGPANKRKITMFTSALPGEGKTTVAANFASSLAKQGLKTILVDLDLRKPSTHKMFGMDKDKSRGTVDVLAGQAKLEDVILSDVSQENLNVLLSGPKAPNPGELLEAERLDEILETLCHEYDQVVLDTAPLLAVPDSRIIAPVAHNVCLVIRADSTPRGATKRAVDLLEQSGGTLSGIVFNGLKEKRFGHNYGYGQYGYGQYGTVYGKE